MSKEYLNTKPDHQQVKEEAEIYNNTDIHQLEAALKRTDMEKFLFLMKLVKTQRVMQRMNITHKP